MCKDARQPRKQVDIKMSSEREETLFSIFYSEALVDPFPSIQKLFDAIKNPNVNTICYHTPFSLGNFNIFQPNIGGFGRFAYLPTGERLYVRVRSFFGRDELKGRALVPISYGETRELTIVVTSLDNPFKNGSIKTILATWIAFEPPFITSDPPQPAIVVAPTQAVYGASVAPFVMIDNFVGRQKKSISIGGYHVLWSGSTTIIDRWDHRRNMPSATSVYRGIANANMAEWVAGVEKRSKTDLSVIFECSEKLLKDTLTKSANRVMKTIEERKNHPMGIEEDPCVSDFTEAIRLANFFFEHGSLGAFIDLLARDTFKGVPVPVFSSPTKFPLYLTTCVILAAFPEMARLPNTGAKHREDRASANKLIDMYRSLTVGFDSSSGQRTTAIEAILAVCCDGVGWAFDTTLNTESNKKMKSVYSTHSEGEKISHVPYTLEHLRRQGAALCQELFGHFPSDLQNWISASHVPFLGNEAYADALDGVCDSVSRANLNEFRSATGATGSTGMATAAAVRHSSKEAMQRTVLEIMLEVNTFSTDGTFRSCRYAQINTPSEDATHSPETGLKRNAAAFRMVHTQLLAYFNSGISELITSGIPRVVCLRPNTVIRCGDCGDDFDPLWSFPRDNAALCEECNVLFCVKCYLNRVFAIKEANNGNTLTQEAMCANRSLMRCPFCSKK